MARIFNPEAIELWRDMGEIETAIRWLGLIKGQQTLPDTQESLETIHETLVPLASEEQFETWYSAGQALSLEDGLNELKSLLEKALS